jgi:antirestriction protein ArdC
MTSNLQHPELLARLAEGVSALTSSAAWRSYLDVQRRFHRYSFRNALLISLQRPDASRVAGFAAWRKLGRTVIKGEKAIWVLAPMIYKRTSNRSGDEEEVIRGFKFAPVFDITQTQGADLPQVCARLVGDDAGGNYAKLVDVARSIGFDVEEHDLGGRSNGDCCHTMRRIRIEREISPAQRVKTLAHELAHALLHEKFESRSLAEMEAESTAYVVCGVLGVDSGDYSFGYLLTWAGSGDEAVAAIEASCQRIQKTAAAILQCCEAAAGSKQAA